MTQQSEKDSEVGRQAASDLAARRGALERRGHMFHLTVGGASWWWFSPRWRYPRFDLYGSGPLAQLVEAAEEEEARCGKQD